MRENQQIDNSKRGAFHHIQGNPNEAISRFVSRNAANQGSLG
jgi:hypothetical protein